MPTSDFPSVFAELRGLLVPFAPRLVVKTDEPDNYCLNTHHVERYRREIFFGAAQIKKNYVSYHLMPVYMFPDLLDGLPPALKARMQGKSCFNFKAIDQHQLHNLDLLTQRSLDRYVAEQFV